MLRAFKHCQKLSMTPNVWVFLLQNIRIYGIRNVFQLNRWWKPQRILDFKKGLNWKMKVKLLFLGQKWKFWNYVLKKYKSETSACVIQLCSFTKYDLQLSLRGALFCETRMEETQECVNSEEKQHFHCWIFSAFVPPHRERAGTQADVWILWLGRLCLHIQRLEEILLRGLCKEASHLFGLARFSLCLKCNGTAGTTNLSAQVQRGLYQADWPFPSRED